MRARSSGPHSVAAAGMDSWRVDGAEVAAVRLARYGVRRLEVVRQLMNLLATVPETFEAARVTGLTIPQVSAVQGSGNM
jgi:DNA polymerase delta subunit 1